MGKTLTEKILGRKSRQRRPGGRGRHRIARLRPVPRQFGGHHPGIPEARRQESQGAWKDRHRPRPHRPGRRRKVRPKPQDDPRVRRRAGDPELLRHPRRGLPPGPARTGFALPGLVIVGSDSTRRATAPSARSLPASAGRRRPAPGRPTRSGSACPRPCASTSPAA